MNVGVFDSGIGGLSVLRKILKELPKYDYIYLGDNRNIPYGEKSAEEIYALTCGGIDFLAQECNCSLIVLACNTASTVLRRIQQEYLPAKHPNIRVLGVIRPAAESILETEHKPVGIMATEATVVSNSFSHELNKLPHQPTIFQVACPVLVPFIEAGKTTDDNLRRAVKHYTQTLKQQGARSILLGCTHYELIADLIREESDLPLISEGQVAAKKLADYLQRHPEIESTLGHGGKRHYYFTRLDSSHQDLARFFMKETDAVHSIAEAKISS